MNNNLSDDMVPQPFLLPMRTILNICTRFIGVGVLLFSLFAPSAMRAATIDPDALQKAMDVAKVWKEVEAALMKLSVSTPDFCASGASVPDENGVHKRIALSKNCVNWALKVEMKVKARMPPFRYGIAAPQLYPGLDGSIAGQVIERSHFAPVYYADYTACMTVEDTWTISRWILVECDEPEVTSHISANGAPVGVSITMLGVRLVDFVAPYEMRTPFGCELAGCNLRRVQNDGVNVEVSFGKAASVVSEKSSSGSFSLISATASSSLFKPSALGYAPPVVPAASPSSSKVEVMSNPTNVMEVKQVKGAEGLANIVTVSTNQYEIQIFAETNVLSKVAGFYQTTNQPSIVYTVQNAAPTNTSTTSLNSTSSVPRVG